VLVSPGFPYLPDSAAWNLAAIGKEESDLFDNRARSSLDLFSCMPLRAAGRGQAPKLFGQRLFDILATRLFVGGRVVGAGVLACCRVVMDRPLGAVAVYDVSGLGISLCD
jgi:hypothetical protein